VGKSANIIHRYEQHLNGTGSAWTNKYKPISILSVKENVSSFEEDKITKEYMAKYGIDKVRGGTYSSVDLTGSQIQLLENEIRGAHDCCFKCGDRGHFAQKCPSDIQPIRHISMMPPLIRTRVRAMGLINPPIIPIIEKAPRKQIERKGLTATAPSFIPIIEKAPRKWKWWWRRGGSCSPPAPVDEEEYAPSRRRKGGGSK